jgi:hypothetical protein
MCGAGVAVSTYLGIRPRHKQQLAEKLGVTGQQVQKDEASLYTKVSFDRIERVAEVLGVRLHGDVVLVL